MNVISILIYVLLIYMIVMSVVNQRKYKRLKGINDCLEVIDNEEEFFPKIDEYIQNEKGEELISRAEVVKLYGIVIHKRYDEFEDVLNQIDVDKFIAEKNGKISIEQEEVSFFYLYLILPGLLWSDHQDELKNKLEEKMKPYNEKLDLQLVYNLSLAFNDYYENKNDRGREFCEKIMDGDYADYFYAKGMIGIYKDLANAMLAKIYLDEGNEDKYQECAELAKTFGETNIGRRWENSIGLQIEEEKEDSEEEAAEQDESEEKKEE